MIRIGLVGLCAWMLAGATGCGFTVTTSDLESLISTVLGTEIDTTADMATLRIINQTDGLDEELTLDIDGTELTFSCTTEQPVCDFLLTPCPERIEAISEQRLDSTGAFQGGRNFKGNDAEFILDRSDFSCGDVIIFRFTNSEAEAFVL